MDLPTGSAAQDSVESLLEDVGGCGLFQILMLLFVHGSSTMAAWMSMFMSFGGYNPEWTCGDSDFLNNSSRRYNIFDETINNASLCEAYKACKHIHFDEDSSTIVTEWNLVCDKSWVVSLIISLHMGGVAFGSIFAGHLNHLIGRKSTLYGTIVTIAAINVVAIFSTSWPMYATLRFIMGMLTGALYLCAYVYSLEFIVSRWRGPFMAVPDLTIAYLSFSVAAYILRDWRSLHLTNAVLAVFWCIPAFWVPESLRWLVVKDKTDKAFGVAVKIAKVNRSRSPRADLIDAVAEHERTRKRKRPAYNMFDICQHGLLYTTFTLMIAWFSFQVIYYAIIYGIKNLSGDFYINLIIFSAITIFSYPLVPILSNTVGRRWGIMILLIIGTFSSVAIVVIQLQEHHRDDSFMTVLSLILLTCVDASWELLILHQVELYPTVLRSFGYSVGSLCGGLGGVVAPFLIPQDPTLAYISYIVMGAISTTACLLIFFLPETKGKYMVEVIKQKRNKSTNGDRHTIEMGIGHSFLV